MDDRTRRARRWMIGIGLGYALVLAFVLLWPTAITDPFARVLGRLEDRFPGSVGDLEFLANIVLFVPAGVMLALLLGPGRRWLAAAIGLVTSVAIEVAQGILLPARVASLSDIIANSTGALLGILATGLASGGAQGRRRRAVG